MSEVQPLRITEKERMSDDITPEQVREILESEKINLTEYLDTEPIDLNLFLDTNPGTTGLN